ncbi:MAG TPA: hypothetical protein VHF27_11540 [Acidimicrobiales bacterium]|nr:hypothetical protein [Acidimicrobiales bacterium]
MKRRLPVLASAAAAAAGLLLSSGTAYAHTVFDTGMVTVKAETRAVKLDVDGVVVALNKVSDPGVQVRVTTGDGDRSITMTRHGAGENGCSAADDLGKGTLNRTIVVRDGAWATVYVKVQYTTTTPIGVSWVTVLEPLGPVGLTVAGPGLVDGVPVSICVA